MKEVKPTAIRSINAENSFYDNIMEIADIDLSQAKHVLEVYKKEKVIKLDWSMGRYKVKHGVFMEKDIILNAVNFEQE